MPESGPSTNALHSPRLLFSLAGLLVVAAVAVVLVAVLGGRHHRSSALPALSQRQDMETVFTEGNGIIADPAAEIAQLHALGVEVVKVSFPWSSFAPDATSPRPPAHFDAADPNEYPAWAWPAYDAIVRDLTADHMRLDLALAPDAPLWANSPGTPREKTPPPTVWKPDAAMFEKFVQAIGTRYSGHFTPPGAHRPLPRVSTWSLWNEPNSGFQLAPQTTDHNAVEVSPQHYRALADAAWTALHRTGHGADTTLLGELAPVGTYIAPGKSNDYAVMPPLRFLRALYCVGSDLRPLRGQAATVRGCPATAAGSAHFAADNPVLFQAGVFSVHPYPQALAPDQTIPDAPDDAVLAGLPKLLTTLDAAQRDYGSHRRFDLWSTEYGYITTPPATQSGGLSKLQAAHWLNWSEYLSWRMPRLLSYDQYAMDDPLPVPGKKYTQFATGLRTYSGARKPGWYAFRMPIWLPRTHVGASGRVEVWGCVRPAKIWAMRRRAPAQIQFRAASGGTWRTIGTVSTRTSQGYFDVDEHVPGSGELRVRWNPPAGGAITSLPMSVTVG